MGTALVTGASSGIGVAFASRLSADGHDLILVGRRRTELEDVADQLDRRDGRRPEVIVADLADAEGCSAVESRLSDTSRPVQALVNNAGLGIGRPFPEADIDFEERMLAVNIRAVLRLTHAALQQMLGMGGGTIVNVSSTAAFFSTSTYAASKAWVISFTESLNRYTSGKGIRVIVACPGYTRTQFHSRAGIDTSAIASRFWLGPDDVVDRLMRDLDRGVLISVPSSGHRLVFRLGFEFPRRVAAKTARSIR